MFRNQDLWRNSVSKLSNSVSHQGNTSDPFEFQTQCKLHQVRYYDIFFVLGTTRHRQLLGLSLQDFQTLPQKVSTENYSPWLRKKVCNIVSSRSVVFCRFCWNDSAWTNFPATNTQLFSQNLSSHALFSCLELFSTTNNICNLWQSKVQQVSNPVFAVGTIYLRRNGIADLQKISASALKPRPLCRPILFLNGISTCLQATIF